MSEATTRMLEGTAPMAAQELGEKVTEVAKQVNDAINDASDKLGLSETVRKNPYTSVVAALGVGYVLGGGLFTPTTARLIRMGTKLAAIPMVRERLLDVAEAAIDGVLSQSKKEGK